jgi:L-lactate permease
LTDILASLAAMGSLVALFKLWKPRDRFSLEGHDVPHSLPPRHTGRELLSAWGPYGLLVIFVLLWGYKPVQAHLNSASLALPWPWLHNTIERMPPAVGKPSPYAAVFNFNWLAASGTACLFAALVSAAWVGMRPRQFARVFAHTVRQLFLAEVTLATVLGLAFLMNYCGATATLGLAFAATGALFPFFSSLLGWLGVFLTGSDTSANALFGNLQVITAHRLGINPVLMAASNSSGGVMGKMISLTSIAVAAAATHMRPEDESRLFRFTLRHSVFLASLIGLIVMFYAYVAPGLAP